MRKTRVKICGITREEDLAIAVNAGADAVGFLVGVPASPRNLTLEQAKRLMKQVPIFVDSVVVTVPDSVDSLVKVYERLGLQSFKFMEKSHLRPQLFARKQVTLV